MKIRYLSGFLGVVLLAGGCGGFSTKRFESAETGGDAGETNGGGGSTAGSTTGGAGGKGGTTGGSGPGCNSDSECPAPPLECVNCPDGSVSCPSPACSGGECLVNWSSCIGTDPCDQLICGATCYPCRGAACPPMELPFRCNAEGECTTEPSACMGRCTTVADCPIPPPDCQLCNSGTCAQMDCISGACEMICDPMPYCSTGDECPSATECRLCPDSSCAAVDCFKGRCDYVCPEL
jgi:hypothetical protein